MEINEDILKKVEEKRLVRFKYIANKEALCEYEQNCQCWHVCPKCGADLKPLPRSIFSRLFGSTSTFVCTKCDYAYTTRVSGGVI
jgi:hypothetical protein